MERKLPIFEIDGTAFLVDVVKEELRQIDNPENRISIRDNMDNMGEYYVFWYSRDEKNIATTFSSDQEILVKMPLLVELDPVGMARKFRKNLEQIKEETDFTLNTDIDQVVERLSGTLPVIDICGMEYIVDIRIGELTPELPFFDSIKLEDLEMDQFRQSFIGYYHLPTRSIVHLDIDALVEVPKDVVQVSILNEERIDVIAYMGKSRADIDRSALIEAYPVLLSKEEFKKVIKDDATLRYFLQLTPVMMKQTAKVTNLADTGLATTINESNKRINRIIQRVPKRGRGI